MKKQVIFKGVATALITPFHLGKIDFDSLAHIVENQISNGTDALVIGGTTAEAATLSDTERYELFAFVKERVGTRVKLIFGTGTNDTAAVIRHTKKAESIGCDGVLIVTPYYNKGTEDGVVNHYLSVAEQTSLPIILYNVPSRTGVELNFNQLDRLAERSNIVAIKEAGDSADRLCRLASYGEDLRLYAGNDSQIYTTLALGGFGVISVLSNIAPCLCRDICKNYFSKKTEISLTAQLKALPLIRALFKETNPAPVKYAMSKLGFCSNELRLPLMRVNEKTAKEIDTAMDQLNFEMN